MCCFFFNIKCEPWHFYLSPFKGAETPSSQQFPYSDPWLWFWIVVYIQRWSSSFLKLDQEASTIVISLSTAYSWLCGYCTITGFLMLPRVNFKNKKMAHLYRQLKASYFSHTFNINISNPGYKRMPVPCTDKAVDAPPDVTWV